MFQLSISPSKGYEVNWFHHHSNVTSLSGHPKTKLFCPCACYPWSSSHVSQENDAWLTNWSVTVKLKLLSRSNINFTVLSIDAQKKEEFQNIINFPRIFICPFYTQEKLDPMKNSHYFGHLEKFTTREMEHIF